MPKVGGRRKKARSHKEIDVALEKELPKIFVIKKGDCPSELQEVVHDLRRVFYPNTAMKLEDNNKLNLKTYLKAAKFYNVTHLVALQNRDQKNFMRIIKMGGGQMRFRIVNYSRMKDSLARGGQPFSFSFKDPLVVLNNFSENTQVRMIGRSIQEMFPPLNPEKIKIQRLQRVISLTYSSKKKIIVQQGGVDNSFAKLLQQKHLDLSNFASIGEYLNQINSTSTQNSGENQQTVKLVQMGPRLKLRFLSYKQKTGKFDEQGGHVQELQNPQMGGGDDDEDGEQ